jgi:hypothetical protein
MSDDARAHPVPVPIPSRRDRDPVTGRLLPGNQVARKVGDYTTDLSYLAPFLELEQEVRAALERERPTPSTVERMLIADLAMLRRYIAMVDGFIVGRGLVDRRGRLRLATVQRLEALVDRCRQLGTLLGLRVPERPVPSLDQYLASRQKAGAAGQAAPGAALEDVPDREVGGDTDTRQEAQNGDEHE